LESRWDFDDLLGAAYLQMHWLMTSGDEMAHCEHCGRVLSPLIVTQKAESATGTNASAMMPFARRITGARRAPEYQGPQYASYTNPPENRPRATAHGGRRNLYFRLTYKEFSPTTHNN
jgi:hypothetical protein